MSHERIELGLFLFVASGTVMAQVASMAHMLTVFGYANSPRMAYGLAVVTVLLMAAFTALGVINRDPGTRWAITAGILLLGAVEFVGNFGAGGLLLMRHLPAEVAWFFGLDQGVAIRLAAFLFAGVLPVLVFLSVWTLAQNGKRLLAKPMPNQYAEALIAAERTAEIGQSMSAATNGRSRS